MKYICVICCFLLFSCNSQTEEIKPVSETTQKQVILALWDSLTAGYGVEISESYPAKLQKNLDEEWYHYEVINAGVSGDTSANLLSRASLYLEKEPNIVILVIWWNDWLRWLSTDALKQNILGIIDTFPESMIVLWGMDVPANLWLQYRNEFKKVYQVISKEREDIYFLEYFLEWVWGKQEYNISDMIHPNSAGYDIIVKNLMNFLEKNKVITK